MIHAREVCSSIIFEIFQNESNMSLQVLVKIFFYDIRGVYTRLKLFKISRWHIHGERHIRGLRYKQRGI